MAGTPFPVSDHCDGYRFFNRRHVDRSFLDVLRWRFTSKAARWPKWVDLEPSPALPAPTADDLTVTWINHASFLIQSAGFTTLIDPVYSQRAGPLGWVGPQRVHAPGVAFENLPHIDAVLLSHDHYDHCDMPTLNKIADIHEPLAITPLGNGALLKAAGFKRVVELDWWEMHSPMADFTFTLTPARHWSNRLFSSRNSRLWGGFYMNIRGKRVHFVGDTGYDDSLFWEIRTRLGPPDLALVPIGSYEPRWFMAVQHCDPDGAVQIHLDLGARQSVAMHWGTFQLTDEAREAPATALVAALSERGLPAEAFRVLAPGETLSVRQDGSRNDPKIGH